MSVSRFLYTNIQELQEVTYNMASRALRILCLSHKHFDSAEDLPKEWEVDFPDCSDLCVDCIVGISDPLRADVKDAISIAQRAGVTVRMVTGDNLVTAKEIARQCGILTQNGLAIEGSELRVMIPAQLDECLPRLQVVARASPRDKLLLVTRLNGCNIPVNEEEWNTMHNVAVKSDNSHVYKNGNDSVSWSTHKDLLLPGHKAEWLKDRPDRGQIVGVTGDGTNDAPALKAADVGLAMGITGTKVAQHAADIVILDDKFSSIVTAILWGRVVYDNIRKFIQFQLTVNIVALVLDFFGAVLGYGAPLNAVEMLWINLIMDTMGALALATDPPTAELLNRKPYKRSASLISNQMWRNIISQAIFQLTVLFLLLIMGPNWFHVHDEAWCDTYVAKKIRNPQEDCMWNPATCQKTSNSSTIDVLTCSSFASYCPHWDGNCYSAPTSTPHGFSFSFSKLEHYADDCLSCSHYDMTLATLIFNTFVWMQIFNEYNCRSISNDYNVFRDIWKNPIFLGVSMTTILLQIVLVEFGGDFVGTTPLTTFQWLVSVGLGFAGLLVGFLTRFIPIAEDLDNFYDNSPYRDKPEIESSPGNKKKSEKNTEKKKNSASTKNSNSTSHSNSNSNIDID